MRKLLVIIFITLNHQLYSQVELIKLHKIINGQYYDNYTLLDRKFFFKNQELINFSTPESSIISYHCLQDVKKYYNYVLGRPYNESMLKFLREADTTNNSVLPIFSFSIKYNENTYVFLQYKLYLNGYMEDGPSFIRLLRDFNHSSNTYIYKIDFREDDIYLKDLTIVLGKLKKEALKMLLGLQKPVTSEEKVLVNSISLNGGVLDLTKLIQFYNTSNSVLSPFLY